MSKPLTPRQLKGIQKGFKERARRQHLRALREAQCPPPLVASMASNLDQLVIVSALTDPPLRLGLIDRLLVLAELEGLKPLVLLTKLDLLEDRALARTALNLYRSLGYPAQATSSQTGEGIEELRQALAFKRSAFSGHSGVGKSSLLRALCPEQAVEVGEVSTVTGKGRHTTTRAQCWSLSCGARLWDLPGLREVHLAAGAEELADCFPDLRGPARRCRYSDCSHRSEPQCGVRQAVEEGLVEASRYRSYLAILGSA